MVRVVSKEEGSNCPKCGAVVLKGERFCKSCGADLTVLSSGASEPAVGGAPVQPVYERRFGFFGRLKRFVVSPSEAMEDVALAPEYGGVFAVLIAEMVLAGVGVALVLQKIQIAGSSASEVNAAVSVILELGLMLAFGLVVVQWLVKSVLVRYLCDSSSDWSFKKAAVVTGYAYFADVVVAFVGLFVAWFFVPSIVIDVSNLNTATQAIADYQAQVSWLRLFYTLPITFFGLLWKSYLGALGSHHGTKKLCSVGKGFVVFFVLGLIGVLISFVL
jgi:hypothetical protein